MVVSMLQFIVELPEVTSLKEKRQIVSSLKDKIIRRFKVTAAEIDLHDSLRFAQLGVAVVSNSKKFGEKVMHKIYDFAEYEISGRIQDMQIYSESFA